ncbi:hypothetical protein TFLX_02022 [Thermoflexales bacterium]|nr:hypothetical protein TFLX_02022 [Thermoflexales bacterium]
MNPAAIFLQQSTQLLTLSVILGGFAFTMTLTLFLSRDQRSLPTATALLFGAATILFVYAGTIFALLPGTAPAALANLGGNAVYATLLAVLILLTGIAVAGWLHSKVVGVVATLLGGGAAVALVSALMTLF